MNYEAFLSRAGERMQQSAIRQMGTVAAENPDIISFAPGLSRARDVRLGRVPGHRRATCWPGSDGIACCSTGPRAATGRCWNGSWASSRSRWHYVPTDEPARDRPAPSRASTWWAACCSIPATSCWWSCPATRERITAFRNAQATLVGIRAGGRRALARRSRGDHAAAQAGSAARQVPLRRTELPEPDRPADRSREAPPAARVGGATRPAHRRGRPVRRPVLRRRGESRGHAADQGRRPARARHLPEQLLEDARAGVPDRVHGGARGRWRRSSRPPSRRSISAPAASTSTSCSKPAARGVLARQVARCCGRRIAASATSWSRPCGSTLGDLASWRQPRGGFFLWVDASRGHRCGRLASARPRAPGDLRRRPGVLRGRLGCQHAAAGVLLRRRRRGSSKGFARLAASSSRRWRRRRLPSAARGGERHGRAGQRGRAARQAAARRGAEAPAPSRPTSTSDSISPPAGTARGSTTAGRPARGRPHSAPGWRRPCAAKPRISAARYGASTRRADAAMAEPIGRAGRGFRQRWAPLRRSRARTWLSKRHEVDVALVESGGPTTSRRCASASRCTRRACRQ